jgi:hypothetical protein
VVAAILGLVVLNSDFMKPLLIFLMLGFVGMGALAADTNVNTNETEAVQMERVYQQFLKEARDAQAKAPTNVDISEFKHLYTPEFREIFTQMVVTPSFGYHWDTVPAPTMTGTNAMATVNDFIAANGWDMQKDGAVFSVVFPSQAKPIRGLPWKAIHEREFPAVTHDGILYVDFRGFHDDGSGVAYNPRTNVMRVAGFKPIGQHWYVWVTTDTTETFVEEYEGERGK